MPKSYTLKDVKRLGNEIHRGFYDYISIFRDQNHHLWVIINCPEHGEFPQRWNHHQKGHGCKKCAIENHRVSNEDILKKLPESLNLIDTYYKDQRLWLIIECPEHGIFEKRYFNSTHQCPVCEDDALIQEAIDIHNGLYYYGIIFSKNGTRYLEVKCPRHSWFNQRLRVHLRGHGCKQCAMEKLQKLVKTLHGPSKGHLYVRNTLLAFGLSCDKDDEDFIEEWIIPASRGKAFDFYLPNYHLLIEFHGSQHYRGWSGKKKNLVKKQTNDQWKANWAKKKGLNLLVIPYTDFEDIPIILAEVLGL